MYEHLVDLLVNRFDVDPAVVGPDVTFNDMDVDSLFLVELLLIVQSDVREQGVEIDEDIVAPTDTLGRAAELIDERVAAVSVR
jgi:acyl carrier protein